MSENTPSLSMAQTLEDKVALLINVGDKSGLSLALSLAGYGADIALVIHSDNAEQTQEAKKQIEMMGRRCLIICREGNSDATFSREVVRRTLDNYGRLDIFIDHSYLSDQKPPPKNQTGSAQLTGTDYRDRFSAKIDTMAPILNHMVPDE
jgi:hypothetical protein